MFDESYFLFQNPTIVSSSIPVHSTILSIPSFIHQNSNSQVSTFNSSPPISTPSPSTSVSIPACSNKSIDSHISNHPSTKSTLQEPAPSMTDRQHPMVTRLMNNIYKKVFSTTLYPLPQLLATTLTESEPTCYTQAAKHLHWREAMTNEFNALLHTNT